MKIKANQCQTAEVFFVFVFFFVFFLFTDYMLTKLTFWSVDKTEVQGEESATKHHGEDDSRGPEVRDVET